MKPFTILLFPAVCYSLGVARRAETFPEKPDDPGKREISNESLEESDRFDGPEGETDSAATLNWDEDLDEMQRFLDTFNSSPEGETDSVQEEHDPFMRFIKAHDLFSSSDKGDDMNDVDTLEDDLMIHRKTSSDVQMNTMARSGLYSKDSVKKKKEVQDPMQRQVDNTFINMMESWRNDRFTELTASTIAADFSTDIADAGGAPPVKNSCITYAKNSGDMCHMHLILNNCLNSVNCLLESYTPAHCARASASSTSATCKGLPQKSCREKSADCIWKQKFIHMNGPAVKRIELIKKELQNGSYSADKARKALRILEQDITFHDFRKQASKALSNVYGSTNDLRIPESFKNHLNDLIFIYKFLLFNIKMVTKDKKVGRNEVNDLIINTRTFLEKHWDNILYLIKIARIQHDNELKRWGVFLHSHIVQLEKITKYFTFVSATVDDSFTKGLVARQDLAHLEVQANELFQTDNDLPRKLNRLKTIMENVKDIMEYSTSDYQIMLEECIKLLSKNNDSVYTSAQIKKLEEVHGNMGSLEEKDLVSFTFTALYVVLKKTVLYKQVEKYMKTQIPRSQADTPGEQFNIWREVHHTEADILARLETESDPSIEQAKNNVREYLFLLDLFAQRYHLDAYHR